MTEKCLAMIPARLDSTRLPNKMIEDIGGFPVLSHTINKVREAECVSQVVVCCARS